jgi:hypothetical protein
VATIVCTKFPNQKKSDKRNWGRYRSVEDATTLVQRYNAAKLNGNILLEFQDFNSGNSSAILVDQVITITT